MGVDHGRSGARGTLAPSAETVRPIESHTVGDMVTAELRRSILSGALPPGEGFSLRELANMLNVSFIPVREALRSLESEGLVVIRPDRRATIAPIDLNDLHAIYRLRRLIEPDLARRSCTLISDSELSRLEGEAVAFGDPELSMDAMYDAHFDFHLDLFAPAGDVLGHTPADHTVACSRALHPDRVWSARPRPRRASPSAALPSKPPRRLPAPGPRRRGMRRRRAPRPQREDRPSSARQRHDCGPATHQGVEAHHHTIPQIRPAARWPCAPLSAPHALVGHRPVRRPGRALARARGSGRPHRARGTAGPGSLLFRPGPPQPGAERNGARLPTFSGYGARGTHPRRGLAGQVQDHRPARTAECVRDDGPGPANPVAGRRGASVALLSSRRGCALNQVRSVVRDARRARRRSHRGAHGAGEQCRRRDGQHHPGRAAGLHRCCARLGGSGRGMARRSGRRSRRARRHPCGPELPTGSREQLGANRTRRLFGRSARDRLGHADATGVRARTAVRGLCTRWHPS